VYVVYVVRFLLEIDCHLLLLVTLVADCLLLAVRFPLMLAVHLKFDYRSPALASLILNFFGDSNIP